MKTPRRALLTSLLILACGGQPQSEPRVDAAVRGSPAVTLLEEYVARDARGERLQSNAWFLNVVVWPDEPAYDVYAVITGFQIAPLHADSSTARVQVTYERAGFLRPADASTMEFHADSAVETTVFTLALTDNGWRIVAPQQPQHVLASAIPSQTMLNDGDRQRLKSLAERVPASMR